MHVFRNTKAGSRNHWCSGKVISTSYSECVFVALCIQPAKLMRRIVTYGLSGSTIFFHIISRFSRGRKKLWSTNGVFWFSLQLLSETFLILRRIRRDINVAESPCKVQLFLSDCRETWIFSDRLPKNTISNFMKIRPVGGELFHVDGRTDTHDEANGRFAQFVYAFWFLTQLAITSQHGIHQCLSSGRAQCSLWGTNRILRIHIFHVNPTVPPCILIHWISHTN